MSYAKVFYAVLAGVFVTLSLAPFHVWPLALLATALLFHVTSKAGAKQAFFYCFLFSLALFISGASWVYVSIHEFGYIAMPLAILLTLLFCVCLALINALAWLPFTLFCGAQPGVKDNESSHAIVLFAATGLFSEWLRGWIFSGFPWLYLGYSQTGGPLAGWAPIGGVYIASLLVYLTGAVLTSLFHVRLKGLRSRAKRPLLLAAVLTACCWVVGPLLLAIEWVKPQQSSKNVSLVQANISQHDKWRPEMLANTLALYNEMSAEEWPQSDLVVWPEAAVPREYHASANFFSRMHTLAASYSSTLVTGVPFRGATDSNSPVSNAAGAQAPGSEQGTAQVHNSVVALGNGQGVYHKQKLVPFGEYIPLESMLGPVMQMITLPLSSMGRGDKNQPALQVQDWHTLPLVCYEIVYPALAAKAARQSDFLLTLSNDAWFGRSIGPLQHLQMAQMRALENGRDLVRSTGSGVSAIIDHKGKTKTASEMFRAETLRGEIVSRQGQTPWTAGGYWLIPLLNLLLLGAIVAGRLRAQKRNE
ncbi:MAG: apolipoprotein N-acyltransferase [Gammaproteobacteria bacterium]|nr:apolipoprotein N-acyltransferase [Gammaproteobacteria bacterium]NND39202.1 apolipoprotein N-acyltransferase [Pseudomonadales bacterium]